MKHALAAALFTCATLAHADPGATFQEGLRYRNGDGRAADAKRALSLIEQAAVKRHPAAMFILSNMLASGEGGKIDRTASRQWLEAAADLEHPEALQQLSLNLRDGAPGYPADEARAALLMRKAAHAMKHRHAH